MVKFRRIRFVFLSQTTEKYENFENAIKLVSEKCEDVVSLNTICDATYLRQRDAAQLAKKM